MRRHLPRLLLTCALLSPASLYALGLGEIRLNSALNQPFDAEIELISPTTDELAGLKIGLASPDMFSRYNLERPSYLGNFDFRVSRARDGRAWVKVTSNRSVTEPFVTLLVEAKWTRGRLLREYTVLLDPPVFMPSQPEAPAPVTTPQAGAQTGRIERQPPPQPEAEEPVPTPEPIAQAPATQEPDSEAPTTEAPAGEIPASEAPAEAIAGEYTVQRNDTLWRIASGVSPGSPRAINRTMIALFRANAAAFDGNINRLRAGSVLRIPDLTEIESIPIRDATAEVARQIAEWSGAQAAQTAEEASHLRLVTPAETPTAPTAAAPTETEPAPEASALGAGTPTPEDKRVELPSPGLAEAQRNLTETPVEPQPSAEQPVPAAETPPVAEQPAQAAPSEQRAPPRRPPVRPVPQEQPAPPLMDRIAEFWWVLVVLGLLLVAVLVLTSIRRRREESAGSFGGPDPLSYEPRIDRVAPTAASVTKTRDRAESFLVEDDSFGVFEEPPVAAPRTEQPKTRPVEPPAPLPSVEDTIGSSDTAVRFEQQDALAEADFHMAYGLYDQAADLVKIAIGREPARRELKLKLLEIYFVWGNKDLFLDAARELHASRAQAAPSEWDKVLIMGKQIAPEDPMFKGGAAAAHVDLVDVNLEGGENRVDVDLFAEPQGDKPAGLDLEFASGERQASAAADLDFLLDEPKRGADEEPTRELDALAHTQETPTIESPMIDRASQTIREKVDKTAVQRAAGEQTAELSLDDLGLDMEALDASGSLDDTGTVGRSARGDEMTQLALGDDEMTQLAPSLNSFDRSAQAPPGEKFDVETTGTIYIDQIDLSAGGGDTVEQQRPDVDSTAALRRPAGLPGKSVDFDLADTMGAPNGRGAAVSARDDDRFSDVFVERTSEVPRIDLDVGEPLTSEDQEPTNRNTITSEMELSELEPVTMSEVGTKLDLARAYMDMGDPDGARSILEEVLSEGNPNQQQEAQRLIESIR